MVLAATGAVAQAAPSATRSSVQDPQFLTANIGSGSECNPGHTSSYDCLHVVNHQLDADPGRFEAISVDEACETDAMNFRADHPRWRVFYTQDIAHDSPICGKDANGEGVSKGDFVASPDFTGDPQRFALTKAPDGPDTMTLTCGRAPSTWFCTVHLPYLDADRTAMYPKLHTYEIDEICQAQESLPGNFVVAGDFNMHPADAAFGRLLAHHFKDTDPTNHNTAHPHQAGGSGSKFDYIYYRNADGSNVSISGHEIVSQPYPYLWTDPVTGGTQMTGFDHDILEGGVTWQSSALTHLGLAPAVARNR